MLSGGVAWSADESQIWAFAGFYRGVFAAHVGDMKYMVDAYKFVNNSTSNDKICHPCPADKTDEIPYADWRDDAAWCQEPAP